MMPHDMRRTMIAYLLLKVEQEDWHGVSDAANDLREMDAVNAVAGRPAPLLGSLDEASGRPEGEWRLDSPPSRS